MSRIIDLVGLRQPTVAERANFIFNPEALNLVIASPNDPSLPQVKEFHVLRPYFTDMLRCFTVRQEETMNFELLNLFPELGGDVGSFRWKDIFGQSILSACFLLRIEIYWSKDGVKTGREMR